MDKSPLSCILVSLLTLGEEWKNSYQGQLHLEALIKVWQSLELTAHFHGFSPAQCIDCTFQV